MRVAIVDVYPQVFGGAHVVHRDISRVGRDRGQWTVTVVMPAEGLAPTWLRAQDVAVQVCQAPEALLQFGGAWRSRLLALAVALPRWWWLLSRELKRHDVVHLCDLRGLVLGGPAAVLARRPLLLHVHNGEAGGRAWRALAKLLLRAKVIVVVPSRRGARAWAGHQSHRLVELPNAVVGRGLGTPSVTPLVVSVGRLHPDKGFDVLVAAVALLEAAGTSVRLRLVGPEAPGLLSHAEDLRQSMEGLSDAECVGFLAEPSALVGEAWIYAQPSRVEPFGLAALEASACGVAVVATAVGGLRDIVLPEVTGLLVPSEDPVELASALRRLIEDADLRRRLGASGRERAEAEFGMAAFGDRLAVIYRSAAA